MKLLTITDMIVIWGSLLAYTITFGTIGTNMPIWFAVLPLLIALFTLLLCESEMKYMDYLKNLSKR